MGGTVLLLLLTLGITVTMVQNFRLIACRQESIATCKEYTLYNALGKSCMILLTLDPETSKIM